MTRKDMPALIGAVGTALLLSACASSGTPSGPGALPAMGAMPAPSGGGWQWGTAEQIMAAQQTADPMVGLPGAETAQPVATPKKSSQKAVTLVTTQVTFNGVPAAQPATLTLTCFESGPSLSVGWGGPVGTGGQSAIELSFGNGSPQTVAAAPVSSTSQVVIDPNAVARFVDEASRSNTLQARAPSQGGVAEARFDANDNSGNLKRFRAVCPTGTN